MLDFNAALELMAKYGYSSSTTHPYIYEAGESIGICYLYNDEDYGTLERVKICETLEELEEFLKQLDWVKKNGLLYHVRMALDNYETMNPKPIFLRNEKVMVEGEMYDIENFDYRENQRSQMDEASKILFEAGDLLLIYDEVKNRQLQYFSGLVKLKNTLREKYFELQKEIDTYNKVKVERNLNLLPDVPDSGGIDEMLEIAIKDRYNLYIAQRPSVEEALQFLREVWELNFKLDANIRYYNAQKEENEIRNELKVVAQKTELMQQLNENYRSVFGVDLVAKFRKINKECSETSSTISEESIKNKLNLINKKYNVFEKIDTSYASDYLREAIQNTNYDDLAQKYAKGVSFEVANKSRTPMHDVAASLSIQYRDKLNVDEQGILVLYNNEKFRRICDAILSVKDFETAPMKDIMKAVNGIKGLSKLKTECYAAVKTRVEDPLNASIKASLFSKFDFTTFETFIGSLVKALSVLKNVNNKMVLNGDINMYLIVGQEADVLDSNFIMVSNDLKTLIHEKGNRMIGITLLKENLPVLYSPYYLDIGDIYSKDASLQMYIREMINFELLVEKNDVNLNLDDTKTEVVKYYSEPSVEGNIYIVKELKAADRIVFCKFAISTRLAQEIPTPEVQPATQPAPAPVEVPTVPVVETPVVEPVVEAPVAPAPASSVVEHVQPEKPVIETPAEVTAEPVEPTVKEEEPVKPIIETPVAPVIEEKANVEIKTEVEKPVVEEKAEEVKVEPAKEPVVEVKPVEVKEEPKPIVEDKKALEVKVEVKEEPKIETPTAPTKLEKPEEKKETVVPEKKEPVVKEEVKEEEKAEIDEQELTNRLDAFLSSVSNMSNTIYKDSVSKKEEEKKEGPKPEEAKSVAKPATPAPAKPVAPAPKPVAATPTKPVAPATTKPAATEVKSSAPKPAVAKPVAKPVAPTSKPTESTVTKTASTDDKPTVPVKPVAKPVTPTAKPAEAKPVLKPATPAPAKPVAPAPKPVAATPTKPVATVTKPVATKSTVTVSKPTVAKPATPGVKPVTTVSKPVAKPATAVPKPVAPVVKPAVASKEVPAKVAPTSSTQVKTGQQVVKNITKPVTKTAPSVKQPVKKVVVAKSISKPVTHVKKEGE